MQHIKKMIFTGGIGSSVLVTSCNKEYVNPSTAPVPIVITNVDALMTVCAGLQRRFTIGRQSPLYTATIGATYSVYGLYTLNIGNTAEKEMETGKGAVTQGQCYRNTVMGTMLIDQDRSRNRIG